MSRKILNTRQYSKDNPKFNVGKHTYGKIAINGIHLLDKINIGAFCSIGPGVETIVEGWHHNTDWCTTFPFTSFKGKWKNHTKIKHVPKSKRIINIGNDVWIGRDVLIFSDVTIGDGAVIGSRCIVTKDVPPYSVAVGNSMRVVKQRFSDDDIARLLEMKWWNWSDDHINQVLHLINSSNINELYDFFKKIEK